MLSTPYLLSSALSSAHYALVNRLESTTCNSEHDLACTEEFERCRSRLGNPKIKEAEICEVLVMMMHLKMVRESVDIEGTKKDKGKGREPREVDSGLVHALNLAKGGKELKHRKLGYLYLNENLSPTDDMSLLLFNTVLKDLQSHSVPSISLALHSIIRLPSQEIAPAVAHPLAHLVSHKDPTIRRLSLAALFALSKKSPGVLSGLVDKKIWKRLDDRDEAVGLWALKVLGRMAEMVPAEQILGRYLACLTRTSESSSLQRECVQGLSLLLGSGRSFQIDVKAILTPALDLLRLDRSSSSGLSLDIYHLISSLLAKELSLAAELISSSLLVSIRQLLASLQSPIRASSGASSLASSSSFASVASTVSPNVHIYALDCLLALPVKLWEEHLGEDCMAVVMSGLDSRDEGVRRKTLVLLDRIDSSLPSLQLDRLISSLPSVPVRVKQDVVFQALEVLEIMTFTLDRSTDEEMGRTFAQGLVRVIGSAEEAGPGEGKGKGREEIVLEQAVGKVIEIYQRQPTQLRSSFARSLLLESHSLDDAAPPRTLALLHAAVACESPLEQDSQVARWLADLLVSCSAPSIQEAILISISGVLSRSKPEESTLGEIKDLVRELAKSSGSKHIRRRCSTFSRIATSYRSFSGLQPFLQDDSTLPSVLTAFESYAATLPPLSPTPSSSEQMAQSFPNPATLTKDISKSQLNYGPYPAPRSADHRSRKKDKEKEKRKAGKRSEESGLGVSLGGNVAGRREKKGPDNPGSLVDLEEELGSVRIDKGENGQDSPGPAPSEQQFVVDDDPFRSGDSPELPVRSTLG